MLCFHSLSATQYAAKMNFRGWGAACPRRWLRELRKVLDLWVTLRCVRMKESIQTSLQILRADKKNAATASVLLAMTAATNRNCIIAWDPRGQFGTNSEWRDHRQQGQETLSTKLVTDNACAPSCKSYQDQNRLTLRRGDKCY